MKYLIYKQDGTIKMRMSEDEPYNELKESLYEEDILVDNNQWNEEAVWPHPEHKEAILSTFRKQLKGKGLVLD